MYCMIAPRLIKVCRTAMRVCISVNVEGSQICWGTEICGKWYVLQFLNYFLKFSVKLELRRSSMQDQVSPPSSWVRPVTHSVPCFIFHFALAATLCDLCSHWVPSEKLSLEMQGIEPGTFLHAKHMFCHWTVVFSSICFSEREIPKISGQ